jgi:hypothetical protein
MSEGGGVSGQGQERNAPADDAAEMAERQDALDAREERIVAREAMQADKKEAEQGILAAADVRDEQADERDELADGRDAEVDLYSFIHDDAYGANIQARRFAALDRSASRDDRSSSKEDRVNLTDEESDG